MKKLTRTVLAAATIFALGTSAALAVDTYKVAKATGAVKLDGDLAEFKGATPFTFELPDGGKVTSMAMWDEKNLYWGITVEDDINTNPNTEGNIWQGDCLQISLDPDNDKQEGSYAGDDFEFGFSLADDGLQVYCWKTSDNVEFDVDAWAKNVAIVAKDGKTTYEIAMPVALVDPLMLKKGVTFGAEVLMNDMDDGGREFAEWTGGIGASKDPSLYNDFVLQ